ncbi:Protein strictosidine synthase-like 4 [Vitis vinifera]|uniref:Protein strictosidine synthase-like 4 n=1 Tax=Vitis vinifera TaxID=29760 RepID=A0A438GEW1_VITVI|nr:Protein strictosidine synthase-like 4 [Vitis vinifera]
MADSTPSQSSMDRRSSSWPLGLLTLILAPVAAAMLLYQLDPYDPAPVPIHEFSQQPMVVPKLNPRMLQGSEMIGVGKLLSPEDIAYHPDSHLIYTGCDDGWVKRITLNDSMVQNWAFTGGRPLGVALGRHGQLVVADAEKVGK